MKNIIQIILVIILFYQQNIFAQKTNTFYSIRDSISAKRIIDHLMFLSSDSLEGRGVGSKGGSIAANYISYKFKQYSIENIPNLNSYFQNIPMHGSLPLSTSELSIFSNNDTTNLKYCLLYTSPSPRDRTRSRMPSSA